MNRPSKTPFALLAVALGSALWLAGCACHCPEHGAEGPAGNHGHHGPPAQALEACKGHAEKDTCSFSWPDGVKVEGTCRPRHDHPELVCHLMRVHHPDAQGAAGAPPAPAPPAAAAPPALPAAPQPAPAAPATK